MKKINIAVVGLGQIGNYLLHELNSKKRDIELKTGKQMMKEGQKERKKLIDTGRAFQFQYSKGLHAIEPGDLDKFKDNMRKPKPASASGATLFKNFLIFLLDIIFYPHF